MFRFSPVFKLYVLTPGRRVFALLQMRAAAQARNLTGLVADIDRALGYNEGVLDRRQLGRRKRQNARPLDREIDRIIGLIHARLENFAKDTSNPELARLVKTLLGALFPQGLAAHVRLPFVEQAMANRRLLTTLARGEYQAVVARLELQQLIEQLTPLNDEFTQLVSASAPAASATGTLQADTSRGQDMYLRVVARVIAEFGGEEDAALCAELLDPVMAQNEAIRTYRRQRRRPIDVDPATGEPAEDDAADREDGADASVPDADSTDAPGTDEAGDAQEADEADEA